MVKKPMTDMTVEELLHCMTDLDYHVILTTWRLAMLSEFDRLKLVMDDACDTKLDAHNQLRDFGRVSPVETCCILCSYHSGYTLALAGHDQDFYYVPECSTVPRVAN